MDKAKITNKDGYDCAPSGHTVEHFKCGEVVTGQVATWALADGAGKRQLEKKAPKTKAKKAAPENKAK